jgi:N-acyl-L-homoserine lactone synthetase
MNVLAIRTPTTIRDLEILDQMHRLRAKVFRGRLSWNVQCVDGREYDDFDRLAPTYIIALSSRARVVGCARLLPAMGTTMLESVFPQLLHSGRLSAHRGMIESSRFCVDTDDKEGRVEGSLHSATLMMFAGIVEWCLLNGYSELATATDIRFERILNRAGWPMRRLGSPTTINETHSVAGVLPVDFETFHRLRSERYNSSFAATQTRAA